MSTASEIRSALESTRTGRRHVELERNLLEARVTGNTPEWLALWTRESELRAEESRLEDLLEDMGEEL